MDSPTEQFTSESEARRECPRLSDAGRQDVEEPKSSQLHDLKFKIDEDEDSMKQEGQQNREEEDEQDQSIHDKNGNQHSDLQVLTEYGIWIDSSLRRGMDLEKKLYPGASTWAGDEERLFEMLYLRQELPILPSFWEIDFRGIPISERCFSTTDAAKPIVYAHCREFRANVRTAIQCGLPHKAPPMIKKALDGYIAWAAQDGSFANLDVVPNIIAETVDASHGEAGVTRTIENRMRALARLQREYLKIHRDEDLRFEFETKRRETKKGQGWAQRLINRFFKLFETKHRPVEEEETRDCEMEDTNDLRDHGDHSGGEGIIKEEDDDAPMANIPLAPRPAEESHSEYRRRPPVVYGLFIVNTSIFLMTVDSARGDGGYVSFHVDIDLKDYKQSVWNALTMAMVVCVARDEMMSRLEDFEEARPVAEVDLDV